MPKSTRLLLWLGAGLIALVYLNSLAVPFYFDDVGFIGDNLKTERLSPRGLYNMMFGKMEAVNRPVANLTLALNLYLSKEPPLFHVVNVGIHIFAFFAVFLFFRRLFELPAVPSRFGVKGPALAFIAAILWALHPIQTQSVTYIVQRMTALCAAFSFLSLLFYLKARTEKKGRRKAAVLCAVFFLLALGSKEIAVNLLLVVLVLEAVLLKAKPRKLAAVALAVVLIGLIAAAVFVGPTFERTLSYLKSNSYPNRDYSVVQRVLTQPRVLWHYVSLTVFPFYNRYILDYGSNASQSLLRPPFTAIAIVLLLAAVGLGLFLARKNPLPAFALLAFWAAHALESSFFNIELSFEHRMYLPSVFLVLFLTAGGALLLDALKAPRRAAAAIAGLLAVFLGLNTVLRNGMWRDPETFYRHNAAKSPGNYRPLHNLATYLAIEGDSGRALEIYRQALAIKENMATYAGIGQCQFTLGEYQPAIPSYEKAMQLGFERGEILMNLAIAYGQTGRHEDSLRTAREALQRDPQNPEIMARAGGIFYFLYYQKIGEPGRPLLEKYGFSEDMAFDLLDRAYAMGERGRDLYVNLPAGLRKKAERVNDLDKIRPLLERAERLLAEGFLAYPGDAGIREGYVSMLMLSGRWREALALPGVAKTDLANVTLDLMRQSNFKDALAVLAEAEKRFGLDQVIEFNRAICRFYLGEKEAAVEVFRRIYANTKRPDTQSLAEYFINEAKKKKDVPK